MAYIYAQINPEGVCVAVTQAYAYINADNMIPVDSLDIGLCGQVYDPQSGNFNAPAPHPTVPQSVSRFQARAALHLAGYLPAVEALMTNEATPMLARLAWQDALTFERHSPTVLGMGAALGLDEAAIDQMFITAAQITA